MQIRKSRPFEDRLWEKIDKQSVNDCWLWIAGKAGKGYGSIRKRVNNKWIYVYAHREVLALVKGEPPSEEHQALHSCDNPSCCNPQHLSWGTESENRREARDRLNNQGNQKLTLQQVIDIKADTRKISVIAKDYLVNVTTIRRIKNGTGWLH